MRMQSVSRTWFYDFVFGFEFIVRERERERFSHISEWQQFQLPVFLSSGDGDGYGASCCLVFRFVYMSVLTIRRKEKGR